MDSIYCIYENHNFQNTVGGQRLDYGEFYVKEIPYSDVKELLLQCADFSEGYILTRVFLNKDTAKIKANLLTAEKMDKQGI
jgi:hypothetical protein